MSDRKPYLVPIEVTKGGGGVLFLPLTYKNTILGILIERRFIESGTWTDKDIVYPMWF